MFRASLSIGGTGMLAKASRWLAAHSTQCLIVSRQAQAFAAGVASSRALEADWQAPDFRRQVERHLMPVEAALLWLHEPGPVLAWLLPRLAGARIVLVLGSAQPVPPGAGVTIVRLGHIGTKDAWRWLTHDEISDGAIAALGDGVSRTIGTPDF